MPRFTEDVEISGARLVFTDSQGNGRIEMDGTTGRAVLGAREVNGSLQVRDDHETTTVNLDGHTGRVTVSQRVTVGADGHAGELHLGDASGVEAVVRCVDGAVVSGGDGVNGTIQLTDGSGLATIVLDSRSGVSLPDATIGGERRDGRIIIKDSHNNTVIQMYARNARLELGGAEQAGELILGGADGETGFRLSVVDGRAQVGREGLPGVVGFTNSSGTDTVTIDGEERSVLAKKVTLGGDREDGRLELKNDHGDETIGLSGHTGDVVCNGVYCANLTLQDGDGETRIKFDNSVGNIELGGDGQDGDLIIKDKNGVETLRLNGDTGDIYFRNADFAEEFDIDAHGADVTPGTVVEVTDDGGVAPSSSAYSSRVAGVATECGIGGPGIVMDKRKDGTKRVPIALVGKVACKVDARPSPVRPGDLLTTAPTRGYAMKAVERERAVGAILGKALQALESGTGTIQVLVTLQ